MKAINWDTEAPKLKELTALIQQGGKQCREHTIARYLHKGIVPPAQVAGWVKEDGGDPARVGLLLNDAITEARLLGEAGRLEYAR